MMNQMKSFKDITVLKNLSFSPNVLIYVPQLNFNLKNNFPIIVKYTVGDLGEIKLALTPKLNLD